MELRFCQISRISRIVLTATITLACISAKGQEQQDSLADMMQELKEVVVKGNLPNTRLKGNAMITRIQGTPLSDAGTLGEMLIKVPGMTGTDEAPEVLGKGYNQIQQNNRFSTHKLMLSLIYRLNATRSKYKGTGAGRDVQARMGS